MAILPQNAADNSCVFAVLSLTGTFGDMVDWTMSGATCLQLQFRLQSRVKRTEVTAELVKSQSRLRKQSVTVIYNCFGLYVPASSALTQRHRTSCRSVNTTRLLPAMSAAPPCHRSVTGIPCRSLRQSGQFSVVVELVKLFENLES